MAQLLECLTLFLELGDNRLKSLQHKFCFISRLRGPGLNGGLLRLTHQLTVRTEHPAEKKEDADQRAEQNGNEGGKQQWTFGSRRCRHDRIKQYGNQRRQQEKSCQQRQSELVAISVAHRPIADCRSRIAGLILNRG